MRKISFAKFLFLLSPILFLTACFSSSGTMMNHGSNMESSGNTGFSQNFSYDVEGLPDAKPSEVVNLKDGDTFEMTASLVKQEIGNRIIKRLAYNGQIPGPLLKVPKGSKIMVKFTNQTDVETTVHSHGLRLDNAFDGVPDVTQKPIKSGESFTYELTFPDEGIYWYHPHIREDYAQELGLYGNFLVEPTTADYWNPVVHEEFLILDDMLISADQPVFSLGETDHALMGRFGNILLINNEENFQMAFKKGEVRRLFITNVANTRPFNFRITDADGMAVKMKLVGGDNGRIEQEVFVDSVILAPSERAVVEVLFDREGEFTIQNAAPQNVATMGHIKVQGQEEDDASETFAILRDNSSDFAEIRSDFDELIARKPDKSVTLGIRMGMMGDSSMMEHGGHGMGDGMMGDLQEIEWEDDMGVMNSASTSASTVWEITDDATGKVNMGINWRFKKGDLVKIRIFNSPMSMHPMQHPIHFHGQRFLVLARDGVASDNLQWKDTTLVKTGETVDILVEMSNLGTWMAHCHIAEHLHSGMMFGFEVKE